MMLEEDGDGGVVKTGRLIRSRETGEGDGGVGLRDGRTTCSEEGIGVWGSDEVVVGGRFVGLTDIEPGSAGAPTG